MILPEEFATHGRDFHYQLTAIGNAAPKLHVAVTITGNRFKIAGRKPHADVSWQVTAIPQAHYIEAQRNAPVEDKPRRESEAARETGLN